MAELNLSRTTTTDFTNQVPDFIMESKALDVDNPDGSETTYYFENAVTDLGYWQNDPIVFSAANGLATWAFSLGWSSPNKKTISEFEHFTGRGNDTFGDLMWNHEVMKLVVGDAFMEIIKNDNGTIITNLVPISPERVRIISEDGRIKRYEVYRGSIKDWKTIKVRDMYHTSNKRIGDQIHGTSQIGAIRKSIDARQEAEEDERTIKHRDKALGIIKYKTNNIGKIEWLNGKVEAAVKNGEMLGVPEATADFEPWPAKSSEDRQAWILSRENHTYATLGVPRNQITADGTTEVGGIGGHLLLEITSGAEALKEEKAIWNQMARKISFTRPPTLAPNVKENQEANTGQTTIQPQEATPSVNR
jgi:hypothetical protein